MPATNALDNKVAQYLFQNGPEPLPAEVDTLYLSLHNASPGKYGNQTTHEVVYTPYARIAIERSEDGFDVVNALASNAAALEISAATAGTANATHFGIGTAVSGAGELLFYGALDAALDIVPGVIVRFAVGSIQHTTD